MDRSQRKCYRQRVRYQQMTPQQREIYLQKNRQYKRMKRGAGASSANSNECSITGDTSTSTNGNTHLPTKSSTMTEGKEIAVTLLQEPSTSSKIHNSLVHQPRCLQKGREQSSFFEEMNKVNDKRGRLRLPQVAAASGPSAQPVAAAPGPSAQPAVAPTANLAPQRALVRRSKLGRNRASPARLFKLNKILSPAQRVLVEEWGWGGMLKVQAKEMPVDLSMWVLSCFDPIRSELAIPGRGSIPVNAESFTRVFGIRNEGTPVCYEMQTEPIKFFNEEYGIHSGAAPEFADWCSMIQDMGGVADLKFLRAYIAGVVSFFLCPTTKSCISPRCYTSLVDLSQFRRSNYAQFAIDQIIAEVKKMGVKKKSVCCCLHYLVTLYLDSLEVDEIVLSEEDCPIRAAAWTDKLIQAVMQKDSKGNGEFGKLRLKEGVGATIRDSLFVGITRIEDFLSSKLPRNFPKENKRKLAVMLGELCTDISSRLGTFVEAFGNLHSESSSANGEGGRKKRQRTDAVGEEEDDDEDDDDYNGDSESEDDTDEDEDDNSKEDEDKADGRDGNNSNGGTVEDHLQEDPECDLDKIPRRSARLTSKKAHDGPASNLRKRSADPVTTVNGVEDLSVDGLIQFSRKKAEEEPIAKLQAGPIDVPKATKPLTVPTRPTAAKVNTVIVSTAVGAASSGTQPTAHANVNVPAAAQLKMPTSRPTKSSGNLHQLPSSSATAHLNIPQVVTTRGVPPSKVLPVPASSLSDPAKRVPRVEKEKCILNDAFPSDGGKQPDSDLNKQPDSDLNKQPDSRFQTPPRVESSTVLNSQAGGSITIRDAVKRIPNTSNNTGAHKTECSTRVPAPYTSARITPVDLDAGQFGSFVNRGCPGQSESNVSMSTVPIDAPKATKPLTVPTRPTAAKVNTGIASTAVGAASSGAQPTAHANVNVPATAQLKMPTSRPTTSSGEPITSSGEPRTSSGEPTTSSGNLHQLPSSSATAHLNIPQVVTTRGVPPSKVLPVPASSLPDPAKRAPQVKKEKGILNDVSPSDGGKQPDSGLNKQPDSGFQTPLRVESSTVLNSQAGGSTTIRDGVKRIPKTSSLVTVPRVDTYVTDR